MREFTKHPTGRGAARAEAAGLAWLAQAAPNNVAEVLRVSDTGLTEVEYTPVAPTAAMARQAGELLAHIHRSGAPAFGAPPPGWGGPYYIGTQQQACKPEKDWARFYVDQRVMPFVQRAFNRGTLDGEGFNTVQAACARLLAEPLVPEVTPARIHGDLWGGNLMFTTVGPIFIDPAAHGGHPETDLAMLALFGAPFFGEIVAGYESVVRLTSLWRERLPIHQLHPLAVHAVTHGPSYGVALVSAAREVLAL